SPSGPSTTARSASRGPSRAPSRRPTSRPSGARSTGTRTGSNMSGRDVVVIGGERKQPSAPVEEQQAPAPAPAPAPGGGLPESVEVFDTTLRDGSQLEGISLTVDDKLRIAEQLDWLGVNYIEGGWPGANPKDDEFFRRVHSELKLDTSTLVAFGSTRRKAGKVDSDDTLRHLLEANTGSVC